MFCTRVAWVCLVCLLLCKEECYSPVSAITEKRDIGLYEVPLYMFLLCFGMGAMLASLHICGIMLMLRAVLNLLVRNASPRRPICFKSLMFSLTGQCDIVFDFVLLPLGPELW